MASAFGWTPARSSYPHGGADRRRSDRHANVRCVLRAVCRHRRGALLSEPQLPKQLRQLRELRDSRQHGRRTGSPGNNLVVLLNR
eukprot:1182021-Prorocentrum_minimum.AAC.1